MNRRTVCIAFAGRHMIVHSNAPEVLAGLEQTFGAMLAPEAARSVGTLHVYRDRDGYHLPSDGEPSVRNGSLADVLQCASYHVARLFIEATPELLWLHAGAAVFHTSALLFTGLPGSGKSTLVTSLCAQGWRYLSDEILAVDPASSRAIAFPQAPAFREATGPELPVHRLGELSKIELSVAPERVCREPVPIAAVILPTYSLHAPTSLRDCSPATAALELLRNCLNFASHGERAVRYLCHLVKGLPAFCLSYTSRDGAAELIDALMASGVLESTARASVSPFDGWLEQSA